MGDSYIVAAYLDGYSLQYGLPQAYSTNRGYGWFPPPPEDAGTVLYVGGEPDELCPYFSEVRRLTGDGETNIWLCTGRQEAWTALWPGLRSLTVG
jgi:hypothetical protein